MQELTRPQDHSIWLRFAPSVERRLSAYVNNLASPRQSPVFTPHITLLGDLNGPPGDTVEICEQAMGSIHPITVSFTGLDRSDEFFMSLYLTMVVPDEVVSMRHGVAKSLGITPSPFTPHVSLAYGADAAFLTPECEKRVCAEFVGQEAKIATISIVSSSREIPIANWTPLIDLDAPYSL